MLAGHLDTVPAQGNIPGRREGDTVVGLGASDMKGGLAVMIELAHWAAESPDLAFDLGFLFFPREEIGPDENALPAFFEGCPALFEAGLVVLPRADRQHDPGSAASATSRPASSSAARAPTRRARGSA